MTIQELITLLQNKISFLNSQKSMCEATGDINGVSRLEDQITTTQITLDKLNSLT